MLRHVRRFHSESAKRKATDNAELDRLEVLHSHKAPRLQDEQQVGGAVNTRGTKRSTEEGITPRKKPLVDYDDTSEEEEEEDEESHPLFVANVRKMGPAKRWKKKTVVNQKFTMTLDQQRPIQENEDLNIEATKAIATTTDQLIDELNIPEEYSMTLQIGSKEHQREGLTGKTWRVPVNNFIQRAAMTQALLMNLANVLNSGEFITRDTGFSASVLFTRPERKGGKGKTSPGSKIWSKMAKESKCVCQINNMDELCCARAIVVMREYAKHQAKEENTFDHIRRDRGKNTQQLKEARKLHQAADVPEGLCGLDEVQQFQHYLGPRGYRILVLDATRGGVIFTGEQYREAQKIIAIVKSVNIDEKGEETAHYDGVYSIKGFMGRSYFCSKCCKGYNTEDSTHHRCLAKNCPGCRQVFSKKKKEEGCPDFAIWKKPDRSCRACKREFYGETCFRAHLIETVEENKEMKKMREYLEDELGEEQPPVMEIKSICRDFHRCSECMAFYKVNQDLPHKCHHAQCRHCLEYVHVNEHRCFITSEHDKAFKRTLQTLRKKKRQEDQLLSVYAEGLQEGGTQAKIDALIAQRKRKLKEIAMINQGVPQSEIRREVIQEQIMADLLEEGLSPEEMTPELVNARLSQEEEEKIPSSVDADHLIFTDIECLLDNTHTFVPILICYTIGRDEHVFHHWGTNCIQQFLEAIHQWGEDEKKEKGGATPEYTVFFHNLKGFDGVLTLNTLYNLNLKVTGQMGTGTKVLHFKHKNLTFKDSLNFLNMPLANFPKTFGLEEMKKGFFPHKFSKLENLQYEGPIPNLQYFEPQHMSKVKKKECEEWHAEQVLEGETWNFQEEMLSYCRSDVNILREGCLKFAQDTLQEAGFNPLTQCITIASTCHYFWRNHQMTPKTLAVEPIHGWGGLKINQSKIALQWLYLEDLKLGGNNRIKHTRNGGEQVLMVKGGKVMVDGYDVETNTVYEFQGCEYHGCPKCKPMRRHEKAFHHPDRTVEAVYQATLRKIELLKQAGYRVVEQWECEFRRMLKHFPDLQERVDCMSWVTPLNPREAFFGGRTGMATCHYQVDEGEEIHYKDVTSLYPFINKYGTYPIGHPTILLQPSNQTIQDYYGLAKVDVLAPEKLLHPVLPVRHNNKLFFPLCLKCVQDQADLPWFERTNLCPHKDEERRITGTWCTPELLKAVEKGYTILKIHEVWHFDEDQRKTGLFAPYVNTWLKHKTEASGWPKDCNTDEKKQEYVQQYEEHEGITLDPERIEKNSGRKQVAKLMLNSFWGKFGENELRTQTTTISDEETWQKIIQDESVIVKDVRIFNEDVMEISTLKKEDANMGGGKVNIFIACFTTAQARLKLYDELDKLQSQVLYYDTDSVIYSFKEGQVKIPTGVFLGEMTDELEGDVITEFGSAGPKSYCYTTQGGKSECKNKGTKSSYEINQVLNSASMMRHIKRELTDPQEERRLMEISIKNHFVRDNTDKTVSLTDLIKIFGVNWDKRVVEKGTGVTYPYGYMRI